MTAGSKRCRFNPLTICTATRSAPPGLSIGTIWTTLIFFMISGREDDSHDARRNDSCASAREGACLCVDRFWAMLPHCAINRPKKNHVGFRISQLNLDTPTTQTPRHTIHSFFGKGGIDLSDSARTPSKPQKSAKPITPCSTRTDRKVLCAAGVQGLPV